MSDGLHLLPESWRTSDMACAREIPGQGLCVVQHFMVTCGLLTKVRLDGEFIFYERRYCFEVGPDATKALFAWDGTGDPPGEWIKEKMSERWRVPHVDAASFGTHYPGFVDKLPKAPAVKENTCVQCGSRHVFIAQSADLRIVTCKKCLHTQQYRRAADSTGSSK